MHGDNCQKVPKNDHDLRRGKNHQGKECLRKYIPGINGQRPEEIKVYMVKPEQIIGYENIGQESDEDSDSHSYR